MRRGLFLLSAIVLAAVSVPAAAASWAPFWSPEGRYAVFPRGVDSSLTGLFLVDSQSTNAHLLGLPPFTYGPIPAPAGHQFALSGWDGIEVRTLGGVSLAVFEGGTFRGLRWSPDGTRFVHADWSNRIFVFDVRSDEARQVTTGRVVDWSPTRNELAVVREAGRSWHVVVVQADGSGERLLATIDPPHSPFPIGVAWSPDGTTLAVSWYEQVDVIGEAGRTVIPFPGYNRVIWSPTGRRLAIAGLDRTILVDADGGGSVSLPQANDIAWSPDGGRFYRGDGEAVSAVPAYGGESVKLVPAVRFALSPDGKRLALVAAKDDSDCFDEQSALFDLEARTIASLEICWIGGGAYDDELLGRATAADEIDGFDGRDRIYARGGDDLLKGWAGADRLYAGSGRDHVRGGPGADHLFTADRERDSVDCGPGRDRAVADRLDSVARNCERVVRR